MALIVEAGVGIKWFIDEPGFAVARRLWRDEPGPPGPGPDRAGGVQRRLAQVRLGQSDPAQVAARLRHGVLEFRSTSPLAPRAIELALELDHPVYDCSIWRLRTRREGRAGHG